MSKELTQVGPGAGKDGGKKGSTMGDAVKGTEAIRTWDDHRIGPENLAKRFETNMTTGLTDEAAKEKHGKYGDNALTKKDSKPWYCLFLEELTGFFSLLLWFGSFLCFIGYGIQEDGGLDKSNLYLGIVLAAVTLATGIFSYMQASKSAEMMAQFENFIPPVAYVIRNGRETKVDAKYIVPGDIVKVKVGENIPCDICVFKSNEMKVDNASLTGESEHIPIDPELEPVENIFETKNVAFFGTMCTAGEGTGICFRTGDSTVIGLIAGLASSAEAAETPLSIEIHRFIKIISAVAIFLGVTFFFFGLAYGYGIITNLVFMIGIIVANVPEGLLATVTVSLALTAQRMAGKMVLVKNLESVETLGSTSCICSDKTGTLTQNRMTVSHMFVNREQLDCATNFQAHERNQALDKPDEKITIGYNPEDPNFKEMVKAIVLGTQTIFNYDPSDEEGKTLYARMKKIAVSTLENKELPANEMKEMKARLKAAEKGLLNIHRHCKGDASETGLVQFAQSIMDLDETRAKYPTHKYTDKNKEIETLIPFSSDIKFNLFIRDLSADKGKGNLTVYMKGAPERIITRCSRILQGGQEVDFTQELREEVNKANADFGALGERVLAFAKFDLPVEKYGNGYKFDVKTWNTWGLNPKQSISDYANVEGSFPMHDLCLVGVVSLNDPPRPKVDLSVQKCRSAGIKVIMVTGDQPPTAAAIAAKVNILKHPRKEFHYMVKDLKMDEEVAWAQSTGIVVHGDLLAEKHLAQEDLPDDHPDKGDFLQKWINKPEVVFARTTPSQKLLIVDACQKAGHVVAVTGDGVNDSPAIKKADIGIAMGSGSDVAKNAADMLLLDDNFSSIVNGVEEGRLIFDNLKKSIAYTLSSNIPEITPFIFFIVFQTPLPLSTVLILCIDLGTDMVPAISFAYENPELDIMDRVPRNSKHDHLVNTKLISFAYFQIGVIQASAGMYTYFLILNDFGIRPSTVWQLALQRGPLPKDTDIYNPNDPGDDTQRYGNTEYGKLNNLLKSGVDAFDSDAFYDKTTTMSWDYTNNGRVDIRLFYSYRNSDNPNGSIREPEAWTKCRWDPGQETGFPDFYRFSHLTDDWPICYSIEALKYAQSGYLVSIVCVQWADLMICKTRNLSLSQQLMINKFGNFGLFFETALVAILLYVPPLNIALGTRQIPFPHFAVPSFSFYIAIFFYDELRKLWLRSGMEREAGRLKLKGWIVQNTYY